MGILKDIEQHKKKKSYPKIIIGIVALFIIGYFSYGYFLGDEKEDVINEVKTSVVTTGDLKTSIFGDGKVLYKEDYNLNFPISGTLKQIYKNEGDLVKSGDLIASLDTTYLEINVDKADIALKKAKADLEAKKNQYTSSDIKLSQDQLDSVKVNLENVKISGENDILNAKNALDSAQINYDSIANGQGDLINLSQVEVSNAKIALDSAQKDLDSAKDNLSLIKNQETEKYNNKLEDIITKIGANVSFNKEVLLDIDLLFGVTQNNKDKNDSFEDYLGAKDVTSKNLAISSFIEANDAFNKFIEKWKNYRSLDSDLLESYSYLDESEEISRLINKSLGYSLETLKNSISSNPVFTEEQINSYINDYENKIESIKKEIHDLVEVRQLALEQKTNLDTKVDMQENTISSLELKLELAKSNLEKANSNQLVGESSISDKLALAKKQLDQAKTNYENSIKKSQNNLELAQKQIDIYETSLQAKTDLPSYSELAPYYTNIENANKSLEEAKKRLEDAVLRSPIDGKIVKVNGNIGSYVGGDKDLAFVTITNNNKFFIESYVEELDISRIKEESKVYLSFDAIDGLKLDGKVYYISDKSTTDNNGIVTYKVEISFDPKDSGVREGMTTYVEYVTNEVKNAKIIPVGAVKPVDGKPSVQLEDGTWIQVVTGFTDSKMVEIISGLEKGDKIIY